MASRRRERAQMCEGKRRHATMGAAITACGVLRRKHPGEMFNACRYRNCGSYHAGYVPKRVRAAIEQRGQ